MTGGRGILKPGIATRRLIELRRSTILVTNVTDSSVPAAAAKSRFPPNVRGYVDALVQLCAQSGRTVVSIVLFGSAVKGDFTGAVSDVDAIVVLGDGASREDKARLLDEVTQLEVSHGLRAAPRPKTALETFVERFGNALSCFICTRSDMLSGDVARVFGLRPAEALFVDRIVLANIILSAVTVGGEDLLPRVPLPPVRRFDVFKALFNFSNQVLLFLVAFALLPDATKYAMGALKRSLHSCFFCYALRSGALEEEVAFFNCGGRDDRTLRELLALRKTYRRSFTFVQHTLPTIVRLHLRTAWDNKFPVKIHT